jgi:hypothetical protein
MITEKDKLGTTKYTHFSNQILNLNETEYPNFNSKEELVIVLKAICEIQKKIIDIILEH